LIATWIAIIGVVPVLVAPGGGPGRADKTIHGRYNAETIELRRVMATLRREAKRLVKDVK
jgi:hypothetical protein